MAPEQRRDRTRQSETKPGVSAKAPQVSRTVHPAETTPKSCLLSTLPMELRLQILRYFVPSHAYFIIRYPRPMSFRTAGVQKLLHEPAAGEELDVNKPAIQLVDETIDPTCNLRDHMEIEGVSESLRLTRGARRDTARILREQLDTLLKTGDRGARLVILTGPRTKSPAAWLPLFTISRQFQQDCYKILYGENRFIFHLGSPGSCARDLCITSEPFRNPLGSFMTSITPSWGVLRCIAKLHLDIKICMDVGEEEEVDVPGEAPIPERDRAVPRPDPARVELHQSQLEAWISELTHVLLQREAPLTEFSLRVKHYRPASVGYRRRYTSTVPEGVPYHMELETWIAKHKAWPDFNRLVSAKKPYPVPEAFETLKRLSGVSHASIIGLDTSACRALEAALMRPDLLLSKSEMSRSGKRKLTGDKDLSSKESTIMDKRPRVHDTKDQPTWP